MMHAPIPTAAGTDSEDELPKTHDCSLWTSPDTERPAALVGSVTVAEAMKRMRATPASDDDSALVSKYRVPVTPDVLAYPTQG